MNFKLYAKIAVTLAAIFVAVQFTLVYVNRTQLKSIMRSEALDSRRMKSDSEEGLLRRIEERCNATNVNLPEDIGFEVTGINDPDEPLNIWAGYTQPVDLQVHTFYLDMEIEAIAAPPED